MSTATRGETCRSRCCFTSSSSRRSTSRCNGWRSAPSSTPADSATPLADAARGFGGGAAGLLLAIGATLSILGTQSNTILIGPRYLFALAKDGYGPAILGRLHPRFRTPDAAIVLQIAIALPLALTGTFAGLATLSVVARLATYFGTIAAVPVLRRRMPPGQGWRLPGGLTIPIAAGLVTVALAASATPRHLLAASVALAAGALVYRLRRSSRA